MKLPLNRQLTNQELARVFNFVAGALALKSENRFRVRAYENAAASIDTYPQELYQLFKTNPDFDAIPGIGDTIQQKLQELFTTGTVAAFQKYVADIPEGAWALIPVHGLGIKRAFQLATEFKLDDAATALEKLQQHILAGEVRLLPGWGEKSETELTRQLQNYQLSLKNRIPYSDALKIANSIIGRLIANKVIDKAEPMGSLRREAATIGDIDIGILCKNMKDVEKSVENMKDVETVLVAGNQLIRLQLQSGIQVDLKTVVPNEWGSFLQHFTGSKEHNIKLREFALKQGKSLSEHGIKSTSAKTGATSLTTFSNETSFYNYLGLALIPPQERVGADEIERYKLKK